MKEMNILLALVSFCGGDLKAILHENKTTPDVLKKKKNAPFESIFDQ